ncbi:MAG: hypothetical protein AMJ69_12300 [Gammaproteobacteria bacterium SG8_47]|nr:MAG: hypothetical protein AMJ69_12300 [Gammaproteobacteria bacterium SG8_47]
MNAKTMSWVLLTVALSACSGIQVSSDYDPDADFTNLRTYAWLPESPAQPMQTHPQAPFVKQRVVAAVDRELAARGYSNIVDGQPDFYVGYHLAVEQKMTTQMMDTSYGYPTGPGWYYRPAPHTSRSYTYEYEEGTLAVDVAAGQNKVLIWRGTAQAELRKKFDADKSEQRINEAVKRILAQFPPKK